MVFSHRNQVVDDLLAVLNSLSSLSATETCATLTYDEVLKIYKDYLKLKNHDTLNNLYQDLGDNNSTFFKFIRQVEPDRQNSRRCNNNIKSPRTTRFIATILPPEIQRIDSARF